MATLEEENQQYAIYEKKYWKSTVCVLTGVTWWIVGAISYALLENAPLIFFFLLIVLVPTIYLVVVHPAPEDSEGPR